MEFDKNKFFEVIDCGDHLNTRTREAYWEFYKDSCHKDIIMFYKQGSKLFQNSEIHSYVQRSIDRSLKLNIMDESDKINPIITPSQKEDPTTWGTNDDVRGK